MTLQFKSLCSGSKGNATLIQATCGKGSHASSHVLVDCGLSLRQMCLRLQQAGVQPEQISAIFITHEHADHIGCARAFALRYRTPVWMSQGTHAALKQSDFDGLLQYASHAQPIAIGALQLRPFAVPHDAREPLQLCATDGDKTLGIATDLGHATARWCWKPIMMRICCKHLPTPRFSSAALRATRGISATPLPHNWQKASTTPAWGMCWLHI